MKNTVHIFLSRKGFVAALGYMFLFMALLVGLIFMSRSFLFLDKCIFACISPSHIFTSLPEHP
jgi:hypothetical protein